MARNVNSSFTGVEVSDVDPNALTRERWLEEAIGDTALVHDLVTGKNTPPFTLDGSGPGNGCVIGLPIANQVMTRFPAYTVAGDGDTADVDAASIWAIPSIQPAGETTMGARVSLSQEPPAGEILLEVRNASWAVVDSAPVSFPSTSSVGTAQVAGLTGGTQYFYRLVVDDISRWDGVGVDLLAVTLGFFRQANRTQALMRRFSSDVEDSTELRTKTASGATVIDEHAFDTAETNTGQAISGYHTTRLAKNQHSLAEMITGAPAGTNSTRTLAASGSQGAFWDRSRNGSEFSNMPLLAHVPVFGAAFGVVPEDGGTGEDGAGGFNQGTNAPGWGTTTQAAAQRSLADIDCWIPYADNNKLRVQILATSPDDTLGDLSDVVQVEVFNANTGASVDSDTGEFTQIGSTNWWWCDISALDHSQAGANRLRLSVAMLTGSVKTPQADGSDLRVVGWAAFLED